MKKRSGLYLVLGISLLIGPTSIVHAVTPVEIVNKYKTAVQEPENKVKVLIVPGHDDEYWGTQYGNIRESDVVVAIGQYLYDRLKHDPRIEVEITRTQMGYTDTFKNYFANNRQAIQDFITQSRSMFRAQVSSGAIVSTSSVPHNAANAEVAIRLYGINKWANENDIDIVLHLHVNDEGGRYWGGPGQYTGISVYIPEKQFDHAPASAVVGEAIFNELLLKNQKSTYPAEALGLLEDQDLIAIGASNTVTKAATVLVEYGYIYEPQFRNLNIQETVTKDLAYQTFLGLHRFFGDRQLYGRTVTSIAARKYLPHTWKIDLEKQMQSTDVSALQEALTTTGVYNCGVVGLYGPCTERGVKAFQKKYGISQTGVVGPLTRAKLNLLFGS
ncbi:peptidoglycan-binding protein [Candidatus Parcubacteria bacterium]|nr:peptidoglycan-binding protein [Candidatus Parcubacteria bacterium]